MLLIQTARFNLDHHTFSFPSFIQMILLKTKCSKFYKWFDRAHHDVSELFSS